MFLFKYFYVPWFKYYSKKLFEIIVGTHTSYLQIQLKIDGKSFLVNFTQSLYQTIMLNNSADKKRCSLPFGVFHFRDKSLCRWAYFIFPDKWGHFHKTAVCSFCEVFYLSVLSRVVVEVNGKFWRTSTGFELWLCELFWGLWSVYTKQILL